MLALITGRYIENDNKIVLIFNYKEDAKTITMAEIQKWFGSDLNAAGAYFAKTGLAHYNTIDDHYRKCVRT